MCGILCVYNLSQKQSLDVSRAYNSLTLMKHRGPDKFGIWSHNDNVILGHARLSIIDISTANDQPFLLEDRYALVFNGEIYNYIELREELTKCGYTFKTQGDTEVLLLSYIHWGEECVKKFNGMWAFCIYDKIKNSLFCSRDRFGEKPIYYAFYDNQFICSSEIKVILAYFPSLRTPNYKLISAFCRGSETAFFYETWFNGIFCLEPAKNLTIYKRKTTKQKYWSYPKLINTGITFDEAVDNYRKLFIDAVKLRMRSDVPVGCTLSSGIDSSSIVSCISKLGLSENINTFTAVYFSQKFKKLEISALINPEIDESENVQKLSSDLNISSQLIDVDYSNYISDLKKIVYHLESGHSSPAIFPIYVVNKFARNKVVVLLEGQGADEALAGYVISVYPIFLLEILLKFKLKLFYKEFKLFFSVYSFKFALKLFFRQLNNSLILKMYYRISGIEKYFLGNLKKFTHFNYKIYTKKSASLVQKNLIISHSLGLTNLLHYGDAISMSQSNESRLPFLDFRLVDFLFTLPPDFKLKGGYGKFLHREAMRNIVPDYILEEKKKYGFESPLHTIFASSSLESPKSILLSQKCINRGLFSKSAIEKAFISIEKGDSRSLRILFRLLTTELWFREFID